MDTESKNRGVVQEAEFLPGVLNVVPGDAECGAYLAAHPLVRRLAFTGSTETGRELQVIAVRSNFKVLTLEICGKCPALVFADADVQEAAGKTAFSIGWLAGHTYFSNSRILVEERVSEEFIG